MQNDDANKRKRLLADFYAILECLIVPTQCFHSSMEDYFERVSVQMRTGCCNCCSFCLGEIEDYTGMIYKNAIISLLSKKIIASKPLTCTHFTKAIKAQKESIFHKDNMPGQNTAQIHGLALTLLAKIIILFSVNDRTKVGTKKFASTHVEVIIPIASENGVLMPVYLHNSNHC